MSPPEKLPGLTGSAPPREPLTDIELLIRLDRLSRDVGGILERLQKAEANDERFAKMEHDFRVAKWMAMLAGGAAVLALANGIISRFSWRSDPLPQPSNAERLGSDRVSPSRP